MNKKIIQFGIVLLTISLSVGITYLVLNRKSGSGQGEIVFMDNFKVFESFAMKKEYDKKLEQEIFIERSQLDSIAAQLDKLSNEGNAKLAESKQTEYIYAKRQFDEKFEKLSQEYTRQVYDRLNIYIRDFGKEHQYRLIMGSSGEGNVMYSDDLADITEELTDYINKKYLDN